MTGAIFIDAGQLADLPALIAIDQRCSSHPWTEAHFLGAMDPAHRTRMLVARCRVTAHRTLQVVGYCAIRRVADEVHVENLAVAPEHQRRGLGRRLLRSALEVAQRDGARTAMLEVRASNERALRLYEDEGFRVAGQRKAYYAEPVEDAVVMLRRLCLPC